MFRPVTSIFWISDTATSYSSYQKNKNVKVFTEPLVPRHRASAFPNA